MDARRRELDERGFHAIRFEGQWGLEAVFGTVSKLASLTFASWNQIASWLQQVERLSSVA